MNSLTVSETTGQFRPRSQGHQNLWRTVVVTLGALALVGAMAGSASAIPPPGTSSDTTTANVQVSGAISLTGLTPAFTLVGLPGSTITGPAEVAMVVSTNNAGGYAVTVQAQTATLIPNTSGNLDSIPIGNLKVRETSVGAPGAFTSLSSGSPVTVHTQVTRSALDGDAISNDYQVLIPFVNTDTYSAELDYVATTM